MEKLALTQIMLFCNSHNIISWPPSICWVVALITAVSETGDMISCYRLRVDLLTTTCTNSTSTSRFECCCAHIKRARRLAWRKTFFCTRMVKMKLCLNISFIIKDGGVQWHDCFLLYFPKDAKCQKESLQKQNCDGVYVTGPVIGAFLDQLMPLLHNCLQPHRDTEMRMSVFTMLAKLLLDAKNTLDSQGWETDYTS